jgi:dihydrofolate synthase/folylpolyglutamate synthase
LDLTGIYQAKNLLGVLNTIEHVVKAGFIIEEDHIKKALQNVCALTGLAGRWQKLSEKPLIIADTGHNEDGIKQVLEHLKTLEFNKLHFVFGTVNDKEVGKILGLLPRDAHYYFVRSSVPRALDEKQLAAQATNLKLEVKSYNPVKDGFAAAKKAYKKNDLIFIGGSTFVVGDALAEIKSN